MVDDGPVSDGDGARLVASLRMVNACAQAMIRATDELTLASEICRLAVAHGGYQLAWVGATAPGEAPSVRPIACAGPAAEHLDVAAQTCAEAACARAPTVRAAQAETACVARARCDLARGPWCELHASSVALPLAHDGVDLGVLVLYAAAGDAFDDDELARLRGLAESLAFGWVALRRRAERDAALRALAEQVLAATPDDPGVQNLVGFLLVDDRRDLGRAGQLLLAARRRAPGDAGILDSWGWLRRALGDLAGAERALARAVLIAPLDPDIVDHAATVALERGDAARAAGLWASLLGRPMAPALADHVRTQLARTGVSPCYARTAMNMSWLARLAVGASLATAACAKTPSKGDCDKLLAHLIDLEVTSGGGDKLPEAMKAEVVKQKAAIKDYAVGQKFIETCTQKTPKKVVACGLAAKNADELAKCDS